MLMTMNNELAARMTAERRQSIQSIRRHLFPFELELLDELDAVEAERDAAIKERDALRAHLSRYEDMCKCQKDKGLSCAYCWLRSEIRRDELREATNAK